MLFVKGGILQPAKQLYTSRFLRHNFTYFAGTMIFGALSYLYYPVLGRLLPPDSFGEVQTLITLFLQYTIFLNVLDLVVINILVSYTDAGLAKRIIIELEKVSLAIGLGIVLLVAILSKRLENFLQFSSVWPFIIVAIAGFVAVPFIFRSGYLQAQKKFALVTGANIVSAGGRLLAGALLVAIGLGTLGAIWGLLVAQTIALGFAAYFAARSGFQESFHLRKLPNIRLISPELKYAVLVLAGSLSITLMYSVDIVVVKHYFDARTAGLYAGISVTARIIFFLTASIAQVLIPSVSTKESMRENKRTLLKSGLLLVAFGGCGVAVFALIPHLILRILLGHAYLVYAGLLPRLSLAIFTVSIANLLIIYFTALRNYVVLWIAALGSSITLGLMAVHHGTLDAVVNDLVVGSACLFGMFLILTIYHLFRQ